MDRTLKQNKCLHSYCSQLADKLNDAGLDMRKTLRHDIDIPWTGDNVREFMFNTISRVQYNRTSSELDTQEIQNVYEILNRHTSNQFGIGLSWPDKFNRGKC